MLKAQENAYFSPKKKIFLEAEKNSAKFILPHTFFQGTLKTPKGALCAPGVHV